MSEKYFILGLLNVKPRSGYDLHKMFETTIKHLWKTEQARVYYVLKTMLKEDLVEAETIVQEGSPNKKLYHITSAGQACLEEWLKTPQPKQPNRLDWLGQIFFGYAVETEYMLDILMARQAMVHEDIEEVLPFHIETIQNYFAKEDNTADDLKFILHRLLTAHYGITMQKATAKWLTQTQDVLSQYQTHPEEVSALINRLLADLGE